MSSIKMAKLKSLTTHHRLVSDSKAAKLQGEMNYIKDTMGDVIDLQKTVESFNSAPPLSDMLSDLSEKTIVSPNTNVINNMAADTNNAKDIGLLINSMSTKNELKDFLVGRQLDKEFDMRMALQALKDKVIQYFVDQETVDSVN